MTNIAIDAMGGDFSYAPILAGTLAALKERSGFKALLCGNEAVLAPLIPANLAARIELVPAAGVFDMGENSTDVLKRKDASIFVATELVREGRAAGVVSAGHSGASMSLATLRIGRIPGVSRPAIATLMPTLTGRVLVLDVGANVDCESENLLQFAIMGRAYARCVMGVQEPRIGLLSNGEEDCKGNKLTKETHQILRNLDGFIGNVEGGQIFSGDCDVVVCDGFTGNVLLKTAEGAVGIFGKLLRAEIAKSLSAKVGYLLSSKAFGKLKAHLDYDQYGGAPLLGIKGCCIISHGKSNGVAVKNAVFQALKFTDSNICEIIENELARLQ